MQHSGCVQPGPLRPGLSARAPSHGMAGVRHGNTAHPSPSPRSSGDFLAGERIVTSTSRRIRVLRLLQCRALHMPGHSSHSGRLSDLVWKLCVHYLVCRGWRALRFSRRLDQLWCDQMTAGTVRRRFAGIVDVLTLAVLAVAVFIWMSSRNPDPPGVPALEVASQLTSELWNEAWHAAHRRGDGAARVRVLQLSDFECPACQRFATETRGLHDSLPGVVAMGYLHLPLTQHRFARQAALVSECEAEQDKFWAAHDSLFANQQDYGLRSWSNILGTDSDDPQLLQSCLTSLKHRQTLVHHRSVAERVEALGTPTVVVNGRVLNRPPTRAELDSLIRTLAQSGGAG